MSYATYTAADTNGSAYDLALANLKQQTDAHAELLAHTRGGRRRKTRRRIRGGAIEFTMPHNVAEPPAGQTNYPASAVMGNILAVGSQHAENSRYDGDMNAAPVQVPLNRGGRRRRRRGTRRRRRGSSRRRTRRA